jgi:rod shape-determining protein MreD
MIKLNSILVLAATVLIVFAESTVGNTHRLLGAQIDLLPALVVYAGLSTGLATLTLASVLGGLLFDSISANPLGVSLLPLFAVGFAIYLKRELILRDQVFAQSVLGFAASAAAPALTLLLILSTGRSPQLGWISLWQWLVMSLGGALATVVLFQLFDLLDRTLNYRRVTETSFRQDREIRRGRN